MPYNPKQCRLFGAMARRGEKVPADWKLHFMVLLMLASPAAAEGLRIGGLIESNHYSNEDSNEDHRNSLYVCLKNWCAGQHENSHSRTAYANGERVDSRFLVYEHELGHKGPLKFTTVFGFVTGYEDFGGHKYTPVVGVSARFYFLKGWQFGRVSAYGWEIGS